MLRLDDRLRAVEIGFGKVHQRLLTIERVVLPAAPHLESSALATAAVLALLAPAAAPASARSDPRILIRQKLELAQQLFGAVVLGRLPAVERDAAALVRISETASVDDGADARVPASSRRPPATSPRPPRSGDLAETSSAYMTIVESWVRCHREPLPRPSL